MLGQATARLQPAPRRWARGLWGISDIHARQAWAALWPHLRRLPRRGVRLLDAGCGKGWWTLEIAARRPDWQVMGIDQNAAAVHAAEAACRSLNVPNATFTCADFLDYAPPAPFDVVLTVGSAHYLAEVGRGAELFRRFGEWLHEDGRLLLFGPRRRSEVPYVEFLPPPFRMRGVFSREALADLTTDGGLEVEALLPSVGRLGTYAKQVRTRAGRSRAMQLATYPLQVALTAGDRWVPGSAPAGRSSAWVLVARKRRGARAGAG